jgi:hypothetical protein
MINALWIDEVFLEKNFPIPAGLEKKNVLPSIMMAQHTNLTDLIGTCLYDHVNQGVIDQDLEGDVLSLFRICQMYLVFSTAKNLIEFSKSGTQLVKGWDADKMLVSIDNSLSYWELRVLRLVQNSTELTDIAEATDCDKYDALNSSFASTPVYYPKYNPEADCE